MKKALVLGAGGFIGSHLVKRLKKEGYWVRGVDLKYPEFSKAEADEFVIGDLRCLQTCKDVMDNHNFDEVYQLAAEVGGTGYILTGENDANIMHNSAMINLNILNTCRYYENVKRIFYSSSACIYPAYNQEDPENPKTAESTTYPAQPDNDYGWEKLFSERLYEAFHRNYGVDIRIARFHNIFGPEGSWKDGRERAVAALCRKIAMAEDGGTIEVWGDGKQTRSFLYIDECLKGILRFMRSDFTGPVNIGSSEMVSIWKLVRMITMIAKKGMTVKYVKGPQGVRGRTSDNNLIYEKLLWKPTESLEEGLQKTYPWILEQVKKNV